MMRICLLFAVFCTCGCAHVQEIPKIVQVEKPIPVPCAHDVKKPDLKTDEQFKAMNDYDFITELWIDRKLRQGYEAEVEGVLKACE